MSFSGLKTALLRTKDSIIEAQGGLYKDDRSDFCASFQAAICDVLGEKSCRALDQYMALEPKEPVFAVAGGVAANQSIRRRLQEVSQNAGVKFIAPPLSLCTDNAAMIAYAASEMHKEGVCHDLSLSARPRWPLDNSQPVLLGSDKKGAKS